MATMKGPRATPQVMCLLRMVQRVKELKWKSVLMVLSSI